LKKIVTKKNFSYLVDDDNFEKLNKYSWYTDSNGYAARRKSGKVYFMHREIMNAKKGDIVDHIDTDKCNNFRSNLRFATRTENNRNVKKKRTDRSTSQYKGVSYGKHLNKKWKSVITVDHEIKHIGCFETEIEAAVAYDVNAIHYYGEYANTNFPIDRYDDFAKYRHYLWRKKKKSSQYRYVTYDKRSGKWLAYSPTMKRHLKYFDNEIDAAISVDVNEVIFKGDKAITNFPIQIYDDMSKFEKYIYKKRKKKTSKYIGVSKYKGNKWRASAKINGKSVHIGVRNTEEEAARLYDNYIIKNNIDKIINNI
jgi:hypothetical protein